MPEMLSEDQQNEEMMAEEEVILNGHVECVKEEAKLLTKEGEIINRVQNAITKGEDFDMAFYLNMVEEIAMRKMSMYQELVSNIGAFKHKYHI
jgi:hypothetical protein